MLLLLLLGLVMMRLLVLGVARPPGVSTIPVQWRRSQELHNGHGILEICPGRSGHGELQEMLIRCGDMAQDYVRVEASLINIVSSLFKP